MIGIGIDFGTSNSIVAFYDGQDLQYLKIDNTLPNQEVMPTALYLDREFAATVGTGAIERYLHDNSGRIIQLVQENVGQISVTCGESGNHGRDTTKIFKVHAMTDQNMPGRLFRGLKRLLGSDRIEHVNVFGRRYRIVALITPILRHLRKRIDHTVPKNSNSSVYIGRPVQFEGNSDKANAIAVQKIKESCAYARLTNLTFYPEPISATLSYLYSRKQKVNETILTFDFGGGTLDFSVIKNQGNAFDILATYGIPLGGDKIDQLIYQHKIFPELGEGCLMTHHEFENTSQTPFPFDRFAHDLLNWQNTYTLLTPKLSELLYSGMRESESNREKLSKLHTLIKSNLSYSVFKAIEQAKIELSDHENTFISIPELQLSVAFTRGDFEKMLYDTFREIHAGIETILRLANVQREEIGIVLRTGGSSQIQGVKNLLDDLFPGKVVEYDTFKSIAAGLAIASFYNYTFSL